MMPTCCVLVAVIKVALRKFTALFHAVTGTLFTSVTWWHPLSLCLCVCVSLVLCPHSWHNSRVGTQHKCAKRTSQSSSGKTRRAHFRPTASNQNNSNKMHTEWGTSGAAGGAATAKEVRTNKRTICARLVQCYALNWVTRRLTL